MSKMPKYTYSDSKCNWIFYVNQQNIIHSGNGGHSLPRNINVGYVNGTRLNGLCCTCSTLNTLKCFPPYSVFWCLTRSAFDTARKLRLCPPKLSHISHIWARKHYWCWWVVDVRRELRREKVRGGEWGGKNPRVEDSSRGQSPQSKVVSLWGSGSKMRLSLALCFFTTHPAFSLSRFILFHPEPLCAREAVHTDILSTGVL